MNISRPLMTGMPRERARVSSGVSMRVVDHVEDEARVQLIFGDGHGLLVALHAAGGGVDEHIEALFGEDLVLEGFGLGMAGEGHGVLVGAVDDEDLRALLDEAEDGGAGRSSGAEDGDARAFEAEAFFEGADDAGNVGVEAVELAVGAGAEGVARADAGGQRVHIGEVGQHLLLEGHGDGRAGEGQFADHGEQVVERRAP